MTTSLSTPNPTNPAPSQSGRGNPLGLVALGLAILALVMAVIPPTSFVAWVPALVAIILAIVALTRRRRSKGTAIAAVIIAPIAWILAIVIATVSAVVAVGTVIDEAESRPTASESQVPDRDEPFDEDDDPNGGDSDDASEEASVGDTATTDDGVEFSVTAIACGIPTAGSESFPETAKGQFCEVGFTLVNGSNASVTVYSSDFTAFIGEAEYQSNSAASDFGGDSFSTDVNPGLSVDGRVYIDIPLDSALDYVNYAPVFGSGGDFIVRAP